MHSYSSPPPNWLWRGTIEVANPPCGGPCGRTQHSPEERDLFTTAKLASQTGEQAKSETLPCGSTCSTRLSYRPPKCWTWRDLNPRHRRYERSNRSLHHRRGVRFVGERSRRFSANANAEPKSELFCSKHATRQPSRGRLHATMHDRLDSNQLFPERSIRALHHRQTGIQGNDRRGHGSIYSRSIPRLHHLEFKTLLLKTLAVSTWQRLRRGWKQKPLRSNQLGRGSKTNTLEWDQPIPPPRESAHTSPPRAHGSSEFSVGTKYCLIDLSHSRGRRPLAKGRVYDPRKSSRQAGF
jgi:hypothetical protein